MNLRFVFILASKLQHFFCLHTVNKVHVAMYVTALQAIIAIHMNTDRGNILSNICTTKRSGKVWR
jgi:hypothetical protein